MHAPSGSRVASIDIIRGAVMVLMAIDHVRVYSGLPPGGPTAGIFFTRWVTHFAFGRVLALEPDARNRLCLRLGLGATALFIVLRASSLYGDPRPWDPAQGVLGFPNTTKYPASLSFLLMTLGPTIALIPALHSGAGRVAQWLTVFGRVPFFYYMLHIPLIHALALVVSKIRLGEVSPWLFTNHPMGNPPPPEGYTWSLGLLYVVWAVALGLLYAPCRWFADLKATRKDRWLSYL